MTYLFISDLHLSPEHPRLIRGFLALLARYENQNTQLFILGDWFNAWIGDDDQPHWQQPIITALQKFQRAGNQIYFLRGNRDFALGQKFLDFFHGQLLSDIHELVIAGQRIRLEHGDALCTDDLAYQRFRRVIRHPLTMGLLLKTPLSFRRKLAQGFRKKSKHANQYKSQAIMDVNATAVEHAMQQCEVLIHGHTHRPAIHPVLEHKQRIVLGDWREATEEAMCYELNHTGGRLFNAWPAHEVCSASEAL